MHHAPAVTVTESTPTLTTESLPSRWTLHGLNNGLIFGLTVRGVRVLPRSVSYAIGRAGTWLAWLLMHQTNAAIAGNLEAVLPGESAAHRLARARRVYLSYARDTIDFLRALSASPAELEQTFEFAPASRPIFDAVLAAGRGGLLVTGHCGNWEIGGLLMSRVAQLPLTVVAMAEADPDVNRMRHEIRARLGIETLEVRQSLETALQIRRLLAANQFVAMLIDRPLGRDRVAVTLFGRQAWFLQSPAVLAYMSGAPLVPCFIERVAPGRFRTRLHPAIHVDRQQPRASAVRAATQAVATAIESHVRANPESWYQFYRYWE
jgi:KDO2-lipid IV(A) lauroyltransferase